MAGLIYALCAVAAFACAWMLLRTYARSRYRLLLWGGLCFVGLTLNNMLLVIDKLTGPFVDLSTWRLLPALAGVLVFLFGLIWDSE